MFVHRVFPMNQSIFAEVLLALAAEAALRCRGVLEKKTHILMK